MGIYSCERVISFLKEPWIISLAKSAETFIMVSISDMSAIKYWQNLGSMMDKAKEKIPKQCRICDTCFTSLATIGVNLFTRHPKNINHVQNDSNNLLSVIIFLVTDIHGGETVFYYGDKMNYIGK